MTAKEFLLQIYATKDQTYIADNLQIHVNTPHEEDRDFTITKVWVTHDHHLVINVGKNTDND